MMDRICLVKEMEVSRMTLRFLICTSGCYLWKEKTLKKVGIEDDKFLFRYAEFEVLLKCSREDGNIHYAPQ